MMLTRLWSPSSHKMRSYLADLHEGMSFTYNATCCRVRYCQSLIVHGVLGSPKQSQNDNSANLMPLSNIKRPAFSAELYQNSPSTSQQVKSKISTHSNKSSNKSSTKITPWRPHPWPLSHLLPLSSWQNRHQQWVLPLSPPRSICMRMHGIGLGKSNNTTKINSNIQTRMERLLQSLSAKLLRLPPTQRSMSG